VDLQLDCWNLAIYGVSEPEIGCKKFVGLAPLFKRYIQIKLSTVALNIGESGPSGALLAAAK